LISINYFIIKIIITNIFVRGEHHRLPGGTAGVQVSGGDGEVRTSSDDTALISGPGEGHLLAFGRDPVSGSLVGRATLGVVVTISVASGITGVLGLDNGLLASGTIGSLVAVIRNSF